MNARILVVEDEYFIAREIAGTLEEVGFEVLGPCASVQAALALLDDCDRCDAAVLDACLRKATSTALAQVLLDRNTPFLVVSGLTADQLPAELASVPVLAKPVHPQHLIGALRRLLSGG